MIESGVLVPSGRFMAHGTLAFVGKDGVTTNNVETYFSIFNRGMKGAYQHCKEKHLQRYLTEFDFRYNNRTITDLERRDVALKGIEGKAPHLSANCCRGERLSRN